DFARFPEFVSQAAYSPSTPREIVERWRAVIVQAPQEIALADFRLLDGYDVRDRLREVKLPALVIGGADDLLTPPKFQQELAAGLGNARAVVVPHAGHMPMHEQPEAVHAALEPFLAEL